MNTKLLVGISSIFAAASGYGIGVMLTQKRLSDLFDERLAVEVEQTKAFYETLSKVKYPEPGDAVRALVPDEVVQALADQKVVNERRPPTAYHALARPAKAASSTVKVVGEPVVESNVFDENESLEEPVIGIITQAEFDANDMEYTTDSLTYYVGDDILTGNPSEDVVQDRPTTVGEVFMNHFGDGHTVWVVNHRLKMIWEIERSLGFYSVEVLGEDPPLETAAQRVRRGV